MVPPNYVVWSLVAEDIYKIYAYCCSAIDILGRSTTNTLFDLNDRDVI